MSQALLTFAQLKAQRSNQHISYQDLLGTQEWKVKRDAIVKRDEGKCTTCGCMPTDSLTLNGKRYHLISIPRDPNILVEVGGLLFRGEDLGDEIIDIGAVLILHVHHLYYIKAKFPWEYQNEALITLCNNCHLEVHKIQTTPIYKIENGNRIEISVETCSRCNGAGYFPQYSKVNDGRCFKCEGARYTNIVL